MQVDDELIAALDECADHLERLNEKYPKLSNEFSRLAVIHWRHRKNPTLDYTSEVHRRAAFAEEELEQLATALLQDNSIEDVQSIIRKEYGQEISVQQMVLAVGHDVYVRNLKREILFMQENSISYAQVAKLWNELERPVLGGDHWDEKLVSMLIG